MAVTWKKIMFHGDAPTAHAASHTNGTDDIQDAAADGSTKGIAAFDGDDFSASSGAVSLKDIGTRVYHNETQTVPDNSETYPSFNSERWDTDTIHDTVTNNERLTCKTAGKYLVVIQLVLAIQGDGVGVITVYKNGLETPLFQDVKAAQAVLEGVVFADSFVADLSVDDYIYIGVFQETGDDAFLVYTEGIWPEFTMQRIG
jgi:hypothetical protein